MDEVLYWFACWLLYAWYEFAIEVTTVESMESLDAGTLVEEVEADA